MSPATNYPLVSFRYSVTFDGEETGFSEVSGLTLEYEVGKYRDGLNQQPGELKMPGRPKVSEVTLKKGIIASDNKFYNWIIKSQNKMERKDIAVNLLDEEGKPQIVWTLLKAWPTRMEGPSFKGDSSEVAIESISLAYDEMTVQAK